MSASLFNPEAQWHLIQPYAGRHNDSIDLSFVLLSFSVFLSLSRQCCLFLIHGLLPCRDLFFLQTALPPSLPPHLDTPPSPMFTGVDRPCGTVSRGIVMTIAVTKHRVEGGWGKGIVCACTLVFQGQKANSQRDGWMGWIRLCPILQ